MESGGFVYPLLDYNSWPFIQTHTYIQRALGVINPSQSNPNEISSPADLVAPVKYLSSSGKARSVVIRVLRFKQQSQAQSNSLQPAGALNTATHTDQYMKNHLLVIGRFSVKLWGQSG